MEVQYRIIINSIIHAMKKFVGARWTESGKIPMTDSLKEAISIIVYSFLSTNIIYDTLHSFLGRTRQDASPSILKSTLRSSTKEYRGKEVTDITNSLSAYVAE